MSYEPQADFTLEELHEAGLLDDQEYYQLLDDKKQKTRDELGKDYCPEFEKDLIRNIQLQLGRKP